MLIRELIATRRVPSQDALASMLAERGQRITQATISRDLKDLGVLKSAAGYHLPGAIAQSAATTPGTTKDETGTAEPLSAPLVSALRRFLAAANQASSMVVLKTSPGHASVIAVELDRVPPAGAVGTVAGDDTIFLAAHSESAARALTAMLREAAGVPGDERRAG